MLKLHLARPGLGWLCALPVLVIWTSAVACSGGEFSSEGGSLESGGSATAGSPGDAGSSNGDGGSASGGEPSNGGESSAGSTSGGPGSGGMTQAGTSGDAGSGGGETCTLTCPRRMDASGVELCECESDGECINDDDCALATNIGQCCSTCQDAYPIETIESEPCIVRPGEQAPDSCQPQACTNVLCPAIACAQVFRAVCDGGQCAPAYDCGDGQMASGGRCVPPCENDSDCVMAEQAGSCCGSCAVPMHRQTVEDEPCLVEYGAEVPDQCKPDPQQCALVACPAVFCGDPGEAVCLDNGTCGSAGGPIPL